MTLNARLIIRTFFLVFPLSPTARNTTINTTKNALKNSKKNTIESEVVYINKIRIIYVHVVVNHTNTKKNVKLANCVEDIRIEYGIKTLYHSVLIIQKSEHQNTLMNIIKRSK